MINFICPVPYIFPLQAIPILFLSLAIMIGLVGFHEALAQQVKAYYVYVEPIPSYGSSYASNAIYDATNAWTAANPNIKFYQTSDQYHADLIVQWVRDFGDVNGRIGEEISGHTIQVGLGDSNCGGQWEPYSSQTVTHIATHEIGHFLGLGHSSDPNNIMYPTTSVQYSTQQFSTNLDSGYYQFVPVCTQKSVTSFSYTVSTTDSHYGLKAYFVSSVNEFYNYKNNGNFNYYSDNGCYTDQSYTQFSGTCQGVAQNSGLLIVTNWHPLVQSLETISVTFHETTPAVGSNTSPPVVNPNSSSPPSQVNNPSIRVANGIYKVQPGNYYYFGFNAKCSGTLSGGFSSYSTLGNDIIVYLLDQNSFNSYQKGNSVPTYYNSGKVFSGTFNVHLIPDIYYVVLSNTYSIVSTKNVNIQASYTCS